MKLRFIEQLVGIGFTYLPDTVADLPELEAKRLIESGVAKPEVQREYAPPLKETAAVNPLGGRVKVRRITTLSDEAINPDLHN